MKKEKRRQGKIKKNRRRREGGKEGQEEEGEKEGTRKEGRRERRIEGRGGERRKRIGIIERMGQVKDRRRAEWTCHAPFSFNFLTLLCVPRPAAPYAATALSQMAFPCP